tara:strand:- start:734 stop:931 length:198 start_codon:yes stop_codon:yes gene_type:complete
MSAAERFKKRVRGNAPHVAGNGNKKKPIEGKFEFKPYHKLDNTPKFYAPSIFLKETNSDTFKGLK